MPYIYHYKATYHGNDSKIHLDGILARSVRLTNYTHYQEVKIALLEGEGDLPDIKKLSIDSLTLLEERE